VRGADIRQRTKLFGLRVVRLFDSLPNRGAARIMGRQLLRSALSVGANYRSACRAKSPADFISKMGTVEEEADESIYWLELLVEAKIVKAEKLAPLMAEASELLAITVASINTAKRAKRQNAKA